MGRTYRLWDERVSAWRGDGGIGRETLPVTNLKGLVSRSSSSDMMSVVLLMLAL